MLSNVGDLFSSDKHLFQCRRMDYVSLLLAGFLAHGLLLISDGLIWDGWEVASWLSNHQWHYFRQLCFDAGHGLAIVANWPFLHANDVVRAYKICGFLLILSVGPLCYRVSSRLGFLTRSESFFLALLAMMYPGFQLAGDPSVFFYQCGFFLFLTGSAFALASAKRSGWRHWMLRVVAIVSFFFSFMLPSLLVFYFGFVLLFALEERTNEGWPSWRMLIRFLISKMDYLLLPFVFFIAKMIFSPVKGPFAGYYTYHFSIGLWFNGFKSLWGETALGVLRQSLGFLLSNPALLFVAAVLSVAVWGARRYKDIAASGPRPVSLYFLGLALLWLTMVLFYEPKWAQDPSRLLHRGSYISSIAGMVFALMSRSRKGWRYWALRALAIFAFFFSFMLPFFLFFYFGFLLIFALGEEGSYGRFSWRNLVSHLKGKIDYLLIPFVFEVCRRVFRHLASDHESSFSVGWLIEIGRNFLPNLLFNFVRESLLFVLLNCYTLLNVAILLIIVWKVLSVCIRIRSESSRISVYMLFFGVLWLCMAAFPYILVGQAFGAHGWATKNSVLFGLPIAVILVALGKMVLQFFPSGFGTVVSALGAVLVLAFSAANVSNYVSWQALAVKDHSAIMKFAHLEGARNTSIFHIRNEFSIPRTVDWYPGLIWTYIFKRSFDESEVRRIFLSAPPENGRFYTRGEIEREHLLEFLPYTAKNLNFDGKQAQLTIRRGSNRDSIWQLALRYWWLKYFRPNALNDFLSEVTHLVLQPLPSRFDGEPGESVHQESISSRS